MVVTIPPFEQQFFGRTGRGLGFVTEFSLLVVLVIAYSYIKEDKLKLILFTLIASSLISTIYSILQRFNFDIFDWNTRTNGIIGTLGNPNFQSSFAAMSIVPTLVSSAAVSIDSSESLEHADSVRVNATKAAANAPLRITFIPILL
jgi:hypothetical protein